MKKVIFVLGNKISKEDKKVVSLIHKFNKHFTDFAFVHYDPIEELPPDMPQQLIFLDIVIGIKKITLFEDMESFSLSPLVTVHDYDLPINLNLLKKLGKIKEIKIIGVPNSYNTENILRETGIILKSISL